MNRFPPCPAPSTTLRNLWTLAMLIAASKPEAAKRGACGGILANVGFPPARPPTWRARSD